MSASRCSPLRLMMSSCWRWLGGETLVAPHQLREAEDRVHGRADLVGHVGEEGALGPVRGLGGLLGDAELLGLLAVGDVARERHDADNAPSSSSSGVLTHSHRMVRPSLVTFSFVLNSPPSCRRRCWNTESSWARAASGRMSSVA